MHKALDFYNVDPIKFSPFHNTCTHLRAIGFYQNRIKVIVIFAVWSHMSAEFEPLSMGALRMDYLGNCFSIRVCDSWLQLFS